MLMVKQFGELNDMQPVKDWLNQYFPILCGLPLPEFPTQLLKVAMVGQQWLNTFSSNVDTTWVIRVYPIFKTWIKLKQPSHSLSRCCLTASNKEEPTNSPVNWFQSFIKSILTTIPIYTYLGLWPIKLCWIVCEYTCIQWHKLQKISNYIKIISIFNYVCHSDLIYW